MISSIKQHLPHLPHLTDNHHNHQAAHSTHHSHHSSSSSDLDHSLHHNAAHTAAAHTAAAHTSAAHTSATYQPQSSSVSTTTVHPTVHPTVQRPRVVHPSSSDRSTTSYSDESYSDKSFSDKSYSDKSYFDNTLTGKSYSDKTYSIKALPAPPSAATVVSETKVVQETHHTVLPVLRPKSSVKCLKARSVVAHNSDNNCSSLSDTSSVSTDTMGKYDNYDYENTQSHNYDDRASVSDVAYRTKEYPSYKAVGPISSVHQPKATTFTIPCHHIRIGDLVILQHRPCQIIRITTSAQTGQHRYLGVDLFTKQLHEEPCVVSHPSPSVVLHSLLGPVFKQYRLIDIRDDGKLVAMTETGEIKQGLKVVDQGHLWSRLKEAFGRGSGSVRVLVVADAGKELAVDYKVVHLAHKL